MPLKFGKFSAPRFEQAVYDFMKAGRPLDVDGQIALHNLAVHEKKNRRGVTQTTEHSALYCLDMAATFARAGAAAILIDEYKVDPTLGLTAESWHRPGQPFFKNLLDETMRSYRWRFGADRSPAGQANLTAMVELLLKKGVSIAPNDDPFDNPVWHASVLADPQRARDPDSPEYDRLFEIMPFEDGDPRLQPVPGPYELMKKYQPEAVASYERAVEAAKGAAATAKPASLPAPSAG